MAQEVQKHLGGETSLEYLKAQGTAAREHRAQVGEAGDDVATEALAGLLHHWGLALGRPAGASLVIRAQAHLVPPVDLSPFLLSLPVQCGVPVRHPTSDGLLLPGSLGRLLWR